MTLILLAKNNRIIKIDELLRLFNYVILNKVKKLTFVHVTKNNLKMKKFNYLILCLLFFYGAFAQDTEYSKTTDIPIHEVKINALFLILGNINLTYENFLNDESSIGGSFSVPFDDFVDWDLNFSATGFYRFHFGDGYADGFYAEGFGMFNNYDERLDSPDGKISEDVSDFAIGVGGGYKLVSKGGVTLEANLGIGRNLFNYGKDGRTYNFVPRGGIHVGYRF